MLWTAGTLLATAALAYAQRRVRQTPYKAPELESSTPWIAILYIVIALIGILVVGFKSSKRTHLD